MATPIYQARNWVYAVTSVDVQPQIDESIRNAHQYRNKLCELELAKRARHEELLQQLAPEYVHITLMIAAKERELEQSREGIQAARIEQRTKKPTGIDHLTTAIRDCKACLKTLRANCKAIKKAAYDDPIVKAAMANNLEQHKAACKEAKTASGLYWATEAIVKQSSASFGSGAPPRFKRYDGTGQIAIQFQGGLNTIEALEPNTLCFLGEWLPSKGKNPTRRECFFRIGSTENGRPIFSRLVVVFSRDLPPGNIKWGYLERSKIADMPRWSIRLTVESEVDIHAPRPPHSVAVHFGWRMQPSGGLRVATWLGTDGKYGSLVLPDCHCKDYFRLDEIAADRSGQLQTMKDFLKAIDDSDNPSIPDWFKESRAQCHHWRSPARFQAFLAQWRENRFPHDDGHIAVPNDPAGFSRYSRYQSWGTKRAKHSSYVREDGRTLRYANHHSIIGDAHENFDILGPYDKTRVDCIQQDGVNSLPLFDAFERLVLRDKCLWQHSCRLAKRITRRRADIYRKFVFGLTKAYGVAYVGGLEVAELTTNSKPEELEADNATANRHARWAAVSELARFIGEKFYLRTIPIDPKNVTRECSACGHINDPHGRAMQCRECNKSIDVDINAVNNTLARGKKLQESGFLSRLVNDAVQSEKDKLARLAKMQEANRNKKRAGASA